MRQISSKSTLQKSHLHLHELSEIRHSPLTEHYESSLLYSHIRSKPSLAMANSENLLNVERRYDEEFELLMLSKLEMDNQILEMELKGLLEEQNFLEQQREFSREKFHQELRNLHKTRQEMASNVRIRESEINEIKELIENKLTQPKK